MKKIHLITFGLIGGILMAIGWPLRGVPVLLFFAFIPMLFIDDYLLKNKQNYSRFSIFFMLFPGFLLFYVLEGYWVINSTVSGGIAVLIFNALLMSITFTIYHICRRQVYDENKGRFLLIFFWITFEYFHLNWELSFPWFNLGNGFAMWHKWIQWYEFTGALGGTFWILLINIMLYNLFIQIKKKRSFNRLEYIQCGSIMLFVFLPLIISLVIYSRYKEKNDPMDIVIVQPNLDPYNEQFKLSPHKVINRILNLADHQMDEEVDLILCPESANQEYMFEDQLEYYESNRMIRNYINQNFPNTKFIIGASTFKTVEGNDTLNHAARKYSDGSGYYFAYNTAMFFENFEPIQLYHKSKLTPGVEMMPSWRILRPLEKLAIDLGGTVGTLGVDKKQKNFITKDSTQFIALICYESVYGEFSSKFVKDGAKVIFIITNDGWWGDTPGYKQHFSMAKLRAIETRRSIAQSANTGTSAFINQRGDVIQKTNYWVQDAIRNKINLNEKITFYVKNGNYIARIASFISALFILLAFSTSIIKKRKSLN